MACGVETKRERGVKFEYGSREHACCWRARCAAGLISRPRPPLPPAGSDLQAQRRPLSIPPAATLVRLCFTSAAVAHPAVGFPCRRSGMCPGVLRPSPTAATPPPCTSPRSRLTPPAWRYRKENGRVMKLTAAAPALKPSARATSTGAAPHPTSSLPGLALPAPLVPDLEDLEPACLLPPLPPACCSPAPGVEVMVGELRSPPPTPGCLCQPRVRPPPPTATSTPSRLSPVVPIGLPRTIVAEVDVATPEGPPVRPG